MVINQEFKQIRTKFSTLIKQIIAPLITGTIPNFRINPIKILKMVEIIQLYNNFQILNNKIHSSNLIIKAKIKIYNNNHRCRSKWLISKRHNFLLSLNNQQTIKFS